MEALDAVVALVEREDLDSDYVTEVTAEQLAAAVRFSTGSAVDNRLTAVELIVSAFAQKSLNPDALGRLAAGLEHLAEQVRGYEFRLREANSRCDEDADESR